MSSPEGSSPREGSLQAPERHPLAWQEADFWNEDSLFKELERVFDICHGCRRCFSLCHAFPTLFDLIDNSDTLELDGVAKKDYWQVVDQCYLCDLCFMTKCPYVPPHPWNVDFSHLMLRAKAVRRRTRQPRLRDRVLSATDQMGGFMCRPLVAGTANAVNRSPRFRSLLERTFGVHRDALLPEYQPRTLHRRLRQRSEGPRPEAEATEHTRGRVVLFGTCYCNYNEPAIGEDLVAVFEHNDIPVRITREERCCGMPKLELGDLEAVARAKDVNVPVLARLVDEGWDIVAPVPSCVLMFKQELPLMYPDDGDVLKVRDAIHDPFAYLLLRHREGRLKTEFKSPLGKIAYHVACHQRVQNIGQKTRELLELIPQTEVLPIERCSGHDGTYAVKVEFHGISMKIGRPVFNRVKDAEAQHYTSDCPMAGRQIQNGLRDGSTHQHPLTLLRTAYGI